jgi:4-hydroxymandelate oxidase
MSNEKRAIDDLVNVLDYEVESALHMELPYWNYLATGAGDGQGVIQNSRIWDSYKILPRILRGISHPDLSVNVLGRLWEHPIGLAPVASHGLYDLNGEITTQEGSQNCGSTLQLSTHSTFGIEDFSKSTNYPWWFQLYIHRNRSVTSDLLERAIVGGAEAIVLTVDTPVAGYRDLDRRTISNANARLTPGQPDSQYPNLVGLERYSDERPRHMKVLDPVLDPSINWKDLEWLVSTSRVPVIVKGITHPDDAKLALKCGVQGLIVSNHGGRNLDGAVTAAGQIRLIRDKIGDKPLLLTDGGIRRGSDIFKAIALGANAVLVGRPYIWGLSLYGAKGVQRVVEILRTELETTMILSGTRSTSEISFDYLA